MGLAGCFYGRLRAFGANARYARFQIEYDRAAQKVSIKPYFGPIYATRSYEAAEIKNAESGSSEKKIVLVEVDEIENLRRAHPNYFWRRGLIQIAPSEAFEPCVARLFSAAARDCAQAAARETRLFVADKLSTLAGSGRDEEKAAMTKAALGWVRSKAAAYRAHSRWNRTVRLKPNIAAEHDSSSIMDDCVA